MCRGQNISNANNTRAKAICFCIFVYTIYQIHIRNMTYEFTLNTCTIEKMIKKIICNEQWVTNLQNSFWLSYGMRQDPSLLPFWQTGSCSCIYQIESSERFIKSSNYWNYSDNALWHRFFVVVLACWSNFLLFFSIIIINETVFAPLCLSNLKFELQYCLGYNSDRFNLLLLLLLL